MINRTLYFYLFIWLCVSMLATYSSAQTITTGTLSSSYACPGGTLTVTFATSSTFAATNSFSAQLSDANGVFAASPPSIGNVTSTTARAVTAIIPSNTANGTGYRIRVVSSAPPIVGTASSQALTVGTPAPPTATNPTPYCQGASAVVLTASGQNLKWYGANATGGTSSSNATIPSTSTPGSTTYYVTQTIDGCESLRTGITVVVKPTPAAPGVSAIEFCQGSVPPILTASLVANATANWYGTNPISGTATATTPTPSNATAGTVVYYVSQTLDGCESGLGAPAGRAALSVRVKAIPAAPGVAAIGFCNNSTASQLTASGSNLKWYDASDNLLSGGAPTPGTGTVGDQTYKVSQTVEGCEGSKANLIVTIKPLPGAPGVSNLTYCLSSQDQPAQTVTSLTAVGQNLRWFDVNGNALSSAPTPSINQLGVQTYQVSQSINGCEGAKATIQVVVRTTTVPTVATSSINYCLLQKADTLKASGEIGGILRWIDPYAVVSNTAPVPSTQSASVNSSGDSFYVYQIGQNGCYSNRATIKVNVKPLPAVPSVAPVSLCQNITANPLTATPASGGTLNWYGTALTGGVSSTTAPTPPTSATGNTTYYVSQSVNGCEGQRTGIVVTVNPPSSLPIVASPAPYCQGATAAPLSATGTSLRWYGPNAAGGTGSANITTPSTSTTGITTYYVTQNTNGCESNRAGINVTVKTTPDAPKVSAVEFCQGATPPVLTATLVANATANWYGTSATGGVVSTTAPVPSNATSGTVTYYVSQTLDGCESGLGAATGRAALAVRVKPLPPIPVVAPIGFCNNDPASQLTASGSGNLRWYDASNNFLSGGAPTPGTGTVGNQTYRVSQTVEGCEGDKATLTVTIKPLPNAPNVTNLNYCLPTQDQPAQTVAALTANGQNLSWFNPDGNAYPNAPTPSISQLGTQTYQVNQTVNGCASTKATIQVIVGTAAAPTVARSLVTYCINDRAVPLSATGETGGRLKWVNPYDQTSDEAPTPYTLNTSIRPDGDPFYVYQIGQNNCYSNRTTIKVLVNAQPTLALVAPTSSVNLGQRAPLQLKFTSAAPYSYTITGGYSGTAYRADTIISVLPRANTTYQVVTVRNSCGVGLPGNPATATVTVRVPTVTTSAFTSSTLCAGTSLTVPFTTTGEFNQGNAFGIELVSVADTSRKYTTSATSAASPITAPVPLTMASGQYYVRVRANNPEIAVTGSNSPTLLTVRSQPTATLTGTQNVYEGYPASLTLTFAGESPWTVTYADSLSSYSVTATINPYPLEVRPSRSTTYRLVSVTNGCGSGPASGTATVSVLPLLGIVDNPLDPLVKTYPVPTTATLTVELDLPLTRDPATLSLTTLDGRPVLQQTSRNKKQQLDLTTQPSGLYFLHIQVGDRQTVRKVLKQ